MMSLGSLGNEGFSSSSSLSALAPPFKVDRSAPKTNSKNPLVHFTDSPFSSLFNSSPQEWLYSHNNPAPGHDYSSNPLLETNPLPSSIPYRFSELQSAHSPATSLAPLNPNPYSDSLIASVAQTESYYPQYVPLASHENCPLVTISEPAHNVLHASSATSLSRSYQDDYTLSLSGLEYPAVWTDGYWNELPDREQNKQLEFDGCFGPKKANVAVSSVYNNYANEVGGYHTCEELLAGFDRKSVNTQARETCIPSLTGKQLHDQGNPKIFPIESSRASVLGSNFSNPETSFGASFLESISTSVNFQRPYGTLHERMRSSPAVVIRPPSSSTNSPARDVFSSKNASFCGSVGDGYDGDFIGCSRSNRKEPHLPLSWQRKEVGIQDLSQISIGIETDDPGFVKSDAMGKKVVLNNCSFTKDTIDQSEKARPELQVPHITDIDNIRLVVRTEAPSEKSSESLDYHNPAVDSPCWKGAPASSSTEFEVPEDTAQLLIKKLEASNGFTVQGPSVFPLHTDDAIKVSFQKFDERTTQHVDACFQNSSSSLQRPFAANLTSSVQQSEDDTKDGPRKEYSLLNVKDDTELGIKRSQPMPEEGKFACENNVVPGNDLVDAGKSVYDVSEKLLDTVRSLHNVSEGGSMLINSTESALDSPFTPFTGEDVPVLLTDPNKGKLIPKVNVQTLVGAMHNLSELLLVNSSYDSCGLSRHDYESLAHVIKNLEACMSKKVGQISMRQESLIPQESISNLHEVLPGIGKGVNVRQPHLLNEATVDEGEHALDDVRLHYMPCQKQETAADSRNNDGIGEAVKKILLNNFHGEEDSLSQTLLYKNLWLEAEAALCSLSYRARYDRMKIEMAKGRDQQEKGISENTIAGKWHSSQGVSRDAKVVRISTSEVNGSPIPHIQGTPVSITASHVDNHEASVRARFHILKCRGENSNSMRSGGQLATEVIDGGFPNKEINWTLNGDMLKDPPTKHTKGKYGLRADDSKHEARKENWECFTDDRVGRSRGTNSVGKQLPASRHSSSLEWEHVLKEEVAWQNR